MTRQSQDENVAASVGPHGFITERFPGRGGIDWAQTSYPGAQRQRPADGAQAGTDDGAGSPYGYDFGSGFLSEHWAKLRRAMRRQ